jgi:hypothetical protein
LSLDEVAYALEPQYEWLKADLAAVDRGKVRKTPLI